MSITSTRQELATAIADPAYIVYSSPKETNTPPCVVLVPDNPYITFPTLQGAIQGYRMTLCVAYRDDEASLGNLETLIEQVVGNLPTVARLGEFSGPTISAIGSTDVLATDVRVEIVNR